MRCKLAKRLAGKTLGLVIFVLCSLNTSMLRGESSDTFGDTNLRSNRSIDIERRDLRRQDQPEFNSIEDVRYSSGTEMQLASRTTDGLAEQQADFAADEMVDRGPRALPPPTIRTVTDQIRSSTGKDAEWLLRRGGIVVGIFIALIAVQRFLGMDAKPRLQHGAVEVCGKVRLDAKQFLHLVRVGERMLVLLESPTGMQRLAEITDRDEVERITAPKPRTGDRSPRAERVAGSATELLEQIRRAESSLT